MLQKRCIKCAELKGVYLLKTSRTSFFLTPSLVSYGKTYRPHYVFYKIKPVDSYNLHYFILFNTFCP